MTPGAWLELAACKGRDTELWFADDSDRHSIVTARSICRACPVQRECLEYGEGFDGMYGGLTARQRRKRAKIPEPVEQRPVRVVGPPVGFVWAAGTTRRLQALATLGHHSELVASVVGIAVKGDALSRIRAGRRYVLPADLRDAIAEAYEKLVTQDAPFTAGTVRIREMAVECGWRGPDAWTAETIDQPDLDAIAAYSRARTAQSNAARHDPDPIVVAMLTEGRRVQRPTMEERRLAVAKLREAGLTLGQIAERVHASGRTVAKLMEAG